jgi:hypothetical protein
LQQKNKTQKFYLAMLKNLLEVSAKNFNSPKKKPNHKKSQNSD